MAKKGTEVVKVHLDYLRPLFLLFRITTDLANAGRRLQLHYPTAETGA